ncbi:MAG: tetratricopeptide repeat protein [Silvibacterium sp.]
MKQCLALLLFLLLAGHSFGQQDQSANLASLLAAAQQAQAANNFAAAEADYRQAVKLRPDIPELWANLGLMQRETGQSSEAIRSFQQALRLKPSLYVPNLFLGMDYVQTGKAKEAIPLLLKAEKMNATDPLPSLTLGRAYSSLGEHTPAIRAFRRAIHLDPSQGSAWFDLGITQLDEVEQDARTMTGQYADTSYAKALYAESLVKQSRYKEAASLYKSILASSDQPPCMQSEAGFLSLKQGDTQTAALQFKTELAQHPECSLAILGEARLNIASGSNPAALQLIQQAWNRDHGFFNASAPMLFDGTAPDHAQGFLNYVTQQQSSGQIDQDLYTALTQAAQGAPSTSQDMSRGTSSGTNEQAIATARSSATPALRNQARQAYLAGHDQRCASLLGNTLDSGNSATLQMLAACSWFTGDYNLTYDAGRAIQSPPSQAQALYWSIKANEKLAYESLAHFQQLEPNSARSHILLGDIYRQRERYDDAQKEYAKALTISPNDTAALLGLASAYYDNANVSKTIETAQEALLQSPDDPEINLLMGEALTSQHKFSDAEPFLLKALKAKPQMLPHVHALLGEAYAADGKTQDAIRELKLGAGSDQDGSVHYHLARLYSKIGDSSDAAAAIQQMKVIQQKRREGAVVAVQDAHTPSPDDVP